MQYRKFGKLGLDVSALGFGMMRLPKKLDPATGEMVTDEEASIANLRWAIDHGVNYVDTAYNYVDRQSEVIMGKALKDGYREKVYIATKSPLPLYKDENSFDDILNEQLKKLDVDCIDMYLFHGIRKTFWEEKVIPYDCLNKMRKAKADGKIKYFGFSFHDDLDVFKMVVDSFEWDFCQIQLNYLDTEYQAGLEGLKYAADKGLAVVIMEPVRGGFLAELPADARAAFEEVGLSPVEGAFNFLWDLPEVTVTLSGMSTLEQVKENIEFASKAKVGMMTDEMKAAVAKAKSIITSYETVPCTACNYCDVCPQNIAIPKIFEALNTYYTKKSIGTPKKIYAEAENNGSLCIGCKACEDICPQHIAISDLMPKIHEILG